MLEKILNLIYPPTCGICGKIDKNFLCAECLKAVNLLKRNHIDFYDKKDNYYNKHFYIFEYNDLIRDKILDYKFNNNAYLYKTFEKILINDKIICDFINCYDIIIPVPIHKRRKRERGYNQTELIIKTYIKESKKNTLMYNNVLIKVKNNNRQSELSKKERKENVKDAYCLDNIKSHLLEGKKILIFDDIYTTGNTVKECARVLNEARVKTIDVLTIAKD